MQANLELFNPHNTLGIHEKTIRLWRPGAKEVHLEVQGKTLRANKVNDEGLFEVSVPQPLTFKDYRVFHVSGLQAHDPYAFLPTLGELDLHLFGKGTHYQLYNILGAHPITVEGIEGVRFAVWAPNAKQVSLVGDFNHWDGRTNPMRSLGSSGVWELFVPGLPIGTKYKFEIHTQKDELKLKSDPFSFQAELRPMNASIVADIDHFSWSDQAWMEKCRTQSYVDHPMNVYELHVGSWKRKEGQVLNYRELAQELAKYCQEMGYTHVEFMPIQEHPLDESWGYQVTGFFGVTSRYGTPQDFQWCVNHLHEKGIGVFIDWVPAHFPVDDFSLARFDGTALFEHEDPRMGFHPHWNTYIFNYGRKEVTNFLIASALFFFDKYHIDGLRVDAVASMLYLDYGREAGEWIPNSEGGNHNFEAIEFMKHLNSVVHERFPSRLMIAEESTSFAGVTQPVSNGGLGFDLKWNMGWMNDTLRYFSHDMLFRHHHHNDLTFGLLYAFSEKFVLALSHDEVVHGKHSLMGKMPGDLWQKFANMRLMHSYQICQPGKKLIFMSGEIAQWTEWNCKGEIEWFLLRYPYHHGIQTMVKDLNHLYLQHPALWERDFDFTGFAWVDFADLQNSVICYLRKSQNQQLLCVHNFTPNYHENYKVFLRSFKEIREIFNTDAEKYGGSGKSNPEIKHIDDHIEIHLAPLATMIFEIL